jgi:outer membrane protein TolC
MNKAINTRSRNPLIPVLLFSTFACLNARSQDTRPDKTKKNTPSYNTSPLYKSSILLSDSAIEEKLVVLALGGPLYDVSDHQIKIAEYKVKSAKKSWFNLLAISANYNDQTFAKNTPQTQGAYVYPKYFFGLTIPIGTIVTKGTEIKSAREEVAISKDNQKALERTIRADVLAKYKQYKLAKALVVLESQVADDLHTEFLQAEKKFNDGSITIEDYSIALRNNNAELSKLLNLQLQEDMAKLDIEKSIGVRLETVIKQ